jgi:arginine repressor
MIGGQETVKRLVAAGQIQLQAEIVEVLHRREAVGARRIAGEDQVLVLGKIDRKGDNADRKESLLIAEFA